jgi:hypothetical protein
MDPEQRRRAFVALVESETARRLAETERRHASCVASGLGPPLLARRFRAERLPDEPELAFLATRLVDWALGLTPGAPRPFEDADLDPVG